MSGELVLLCKLKTLAERKRGLVNRNSVGPPHAENREREVKRQRQTLVSDDEETHDTATRGYTAFGRDLQAHLVQLRGLLVL